MTKEEEVYIVKENIIDLLFAYDESVRVKHQEIIELAEHLESMKPIPQRLILPKRATDTEKQHRYFYDSIFRAHVDMLVEYILKDKQ